MPSQGKSKISVEVPTETEERVHQAFAAAYGYQDEVPGEDGELGPNPQSRADFTAERIRAFVYDTVIAQESLAEGDKARQKAADKARKDLEG